MTRFLDTLLGADVPVIAELKPRTATGTALIGDRTAAQLVTAYQDCGVACLSVVTGRWFGGDIGLLAEVTGRSRLPVLQKDFITSSSHLRRAGELGAAAVLLTARLLSVAALNRLAGHAVELGLTPFVEVTDAAEIASIERAGDCVVAVNNKDIDDRERGAGDVRRSFRLIPALRASGTRCPVSASGIASPATAVALLTAGYHGVLVGTSLLTADDLFGWFCDLNSLRRASRERSPI